MNSYEQDELDKERVESRGREEGVRGKGAGLRLEEGEQQEREGKDEEV